MAPGQFLIRACGEKFTEEDLSSEGNAFAQYYYKSKARWGEYMDDYQLLFAERGRSLYHVPDTWEIYDRIAPLIQERFDEWRAKV